MGERLSVILPHRGVLSVAGEDRRSFLQGLVSNDMTRVAADRAAWAAFLTPQGKFLHEFFVVEHGDALLLEGEAERLDDLRRRLSIYKLRSKVTLARPEGWVVAALIGDGAAEAVGLRPEAGAAAAFGAGVAFVDPRLPAAGLRALLPAEGAAGATAAAGFREGGFADYDRLRIAAGLPDGSRDMAVEKAILLENGFDELHGVDWQKGCYLGQELTARTKYRGLIKKRLMPVTIDGPAPEPGTPLMAGEHEAGEMRSSCGDLGLALVRLEFLDQAGQGFAAGPARVFPRKPDWANF